MNCRPGTQFQLHAHPNLELVYCEQGALHEIRMEGDPLTNHFDECNQDPNNAPRHRQQSCRRVQGPNLTSLQRSWRFATLPEGRWLVNEVGSIHKSFTSTASTGCRLLALWGGSHANILHPPVSVNIQEAVEVTDHKLGLLRQWANVTTTNNTSSTDHCDCTNWASISETFLPESECKKLEK